MAGLYGNIPLFGAATPQPGYEYTIRDLKIPEGILFNIHNVINFTNVSAKTSGGKVVRQTINANHTLDILNPGETQGDTNRILTGIIQAMIEGFQSAETMTLYFEGGSLPYVNLGSPNYPNFKYIAKVRYASSTNKDFYIEMEIRHGKGVGASYEFRMNFVKLNEGQSLNLLSDYISTKSFSFNKEGVPVIGETKANFKFAHDEITKYEKDGVSYLAYDKSYGYTIGILGGSSETYRRTSGGSYWVSNPYTLKLKIKSGGSGGGGGAGGDTSKPGGGGGSQDNTSSVIPPTIFPGRPEDPGFVQGAVRSGLITAYNPTKDQLAEFSTFLWSENLFDQLVKYFRDPLTLVVKFMLIPAKPPEGVMSPVYIGLSPLNPDFKMPKLNSQFFSVDLGSIELKPYWGNALDFDPYTEIQIFLPFIGFQTISADDVMGRTIHLYYNIDVITGSCTAVIECVSEELTSVLYSFQGNIGMDIPISGNILGAHLGDVMTPLANGAGTAISAKTAATAAGAGAAAGLAAPVVGTAAVAVNAMKRTFTRSGNISSNTGFMSPLRPYLVIKRPIQSLPENFQGFKGYPSNITESLGKLKGYTQVGYIHLENIPATMEELNEIESKLKEGVIL